MGSGRYFGFCLVLWGLVLCWEVLWFWIVLGISAWDMGGDLVLDCISGFRCGTWEVLCVLDCIWDFGVGFGRCFVYCGFEGLNS